MDNYDAFEAAEIAEMYEDELLDNIAELTQQREELLDALQALLDAHTKGYPISGEFIRAAIAKASGV